MTELVDVVDINNKVVGQVPRRRARELNLLHRGVAIVCHDAQDVRKIFVHQRSYAKDTFPGQWDMFVTGVVKAGEAVEEAARRELWEELGVDSEPVRQFDHLIDGPLYRCWVAVFSASIPSAVRFRDGEIISGRFVLRTDLAAPSRRVSFVTDRIAMYETYCEAEDRSLATTARI